MSLPLRSMAALSPIPDKDMIWEENNSEIESYLKRFSLRSAKTIALEVM